MEFTSRKNRKQIRCSWRADASRYQICYSWAPGSWKLTPFTNRDKDREAAILWAKDSELYFKSFEKPGAPPFDEFVKGFFDVGGDYYQTKEAHDKHFLDSFYTKKAGYLKNYIAPFFKSLPVNLITTDLCEQFTLTLTGLAADTKNAIIDTLREIFAPMVKKGLLSSNPAVGVERFHVESKERPPFTREELAKLFPDDISEAVKIWGSPIYYAWGLVLRDSGCRPSEALAWTWQDYSETWGGFPIVKRIRGYKGEVHPGTKGGRRHYRAAILSDTANKILGEIRRTSETDRIFPWRVDQGNLYFRMAMARAKIPEYIPGFDLPRTQYSLRHTAVTQTIGIDRDFAKEAFGHRTIKNQENYDHPDTDALFERISRAPEILKKRLQ